MNKNQTANSKMEKRSSVLLDTAKEKDADDLVHEVHEPNKKEEIGIDKGLDPDDLIHSQQPIVEPGSLPDTETAPIDEDIEDEMMR